MLTVFKALLPLFLLSIHPVFAESKPSAIDRPKASNFSLPSVEFYNSQNQIVQIKSKVEPYFQINDEKADVFFLRLSIKFDKSVDSITLGQGTVQKIDKEIARLLIAGLKDTLKVKFSDGSTLDYRVELKFQKVELITRNCNTKSFAINVPEIKENFYIAASCKDTKSSIQASITIPQELNWGPSTVFETAGKGERWKLFNFNQLNLSSKSGEIGRITVLKEGVPAPCLITFLPGAGPGNGEKPVDTTPHRKVALVRVPIGVSQQSVKSEDLDSAGLGYLLAFDGKFFPEKSHWVLSGKYKNVLSTASDGQSLSLFQAGGGYSFGKEFGSGTTYLAMLNFDSFSSQAPKVKVNIVHSQVGINFHMLKFDEKLRKGWSLDFFLSGYLPKADSQVMGLEFEYLFASEGVGKGIFFNYMSEGFEFKKSATSDTKSKVQSSQIQVGLVLHF